MTTDRGRITICLTCLMIVALTAGASAQLRHVPGVTKYTPPDGHAIPRHAEAHPKTVQGPPPFTKAWTYTESNASLVCVQTDLEGNVLLVGTLQSPARLRVQKLDGAQNTLPSVIWDISTQELNSFFQCAIDLDGNLYVAGTGPVPSGTAEKIAKISPSGSIEWIQTYLHQLNTDHLFTSLTLDPEGVLFATHTVDDTVRVYQIDPRNGVVAWDTNLEDSSVQTCVSQVQFAKAQISNRGQLFVLASNPTNSTQSLLVALDAATGKSKWCEVLDMKYSLSGGVIGDIAVDSDGNVITSGQRQSGPIVEKRTPEGVLLWSNFLNTTTLPDQAWWNTLRVAPDDSIAVGGGRYVASRSTAVVRKYAADGTFLWEGSAFTETFTHSFGFLFNNTRVFQIAYDRLGNIYTTIQIHLPDRSELGTIKWAAASGSTTGTQLWSDIAVNPVALVSRFPSGLTVDGGANVYVIYFDSSGVQAAIKYTQPFDGAVFTKQTASATLTFEDQSIWRPGVGNIVKEKHLFTRGWGTYNGASPIGFNLNKSFKIPLLGRFGGIAKFLTSGELRAGLKAEVNGGSADVHFPFDVEYVIPPSDNIFPGMSVNINVKWKADPAARLTSCFTPTFNAGLTAGVDYDICAQAGLTAFSRELFNKIFVDVTRSIADDYIPGLNLLDILALVGLPVPGEWTSIDLPPKGLFVAEFRTPQIFAQSCFDPATNEFQTDARDRFFKFGISVTEALLKFVGATAQFDFQVPKREETGGGGGDGGPPLKECDGGANDGKRCRNASDCPDGTCKSVDDNSSGGKFLDFTLEVGAELLQLIAKVELGARQRINVGAVPQIEYDVYHNGALLQTIGPVPVTQTSFAVTPPGSGFNGRLDIIPTVKGTMADFHNRTDIEIFPGIEWKTLDLAITAAVRGWEIITFNRCILCFDWDLNEILTALGIPPLDIHIKAFPGLFNDNATCVGGSNDGDPCDNDSDCSDPGVCYGSWEIPFDDQTLPCFRIMGQTTSQPRLASASRNSMSMILYDQTSPRVTSFNVSTNGVTRMLLFGERLLLGTVARIEHWGRIESLTTTRINDNTLLVEMPNRFRLIPGVAKIWVERSGLISETIDMPIEYPRPRLDAVNPNLWAADPDLAVLPISVIDAKSFAGNDTYIARRDYFILMRDELWTSLTANGVSATAYFPLFDFNQMPGFPAVLWGPESPTCASGANIGLPCTTDADCPLSRCNEMLPLPRFIQPVDNGIHNVRLAEHQYDRPQAVPVRICNPGPGGGVSNELILTIAAPVPVASSVEPNGMSPTDIKYAEDDFDLFDVPVAQPVELRVFGPNHVPQFRGYEEPKSGNFNADSIVRFDGVDLPTTFTASFLLTAQLPPEMVIPGDHWITVYTPSNGTKYFEEKRVDSFCVGGTKRCYGGVNFGQTCTTNANCADPSLVGYDGLCVAQSCATTSDCSLGGTCQPANGVPLVQGLLGSGGESAPLLFRIRYRQPDITALNPPIADVGSPAFDESTINGTLVCVGGINDGQACAAAPDCPGGSCDLIPAEIGKAVCVGGVNDGLDCAETDPDCPGGSCEVVPASQCVGGDNDGLPCDVIGDCPGGSSCDPVVFDTYNTCVVGTDFQAVCTGGANDGELCATDTDCPGGTCLGPQVFFDGALRDSVFMSSNVLRVKLLPEDVAEAGLFPVTVKNPDLQVSDPQYFEVVTPVEAMAVRAKVIRQLFREKKDVPTQEEIEGTVRIIRGRSE